MANIALYKIVYKHWHPSDTDGSFILYDNSAAKKPYCYEFDLFVREYARKTTANHDYTGFLSHKFKTKTFISIADFRSFIEKNPGYDVYFVDGGSTEFPFQNVWLQGDHHHKGLLDLAQRIFDELGYKIDLRVMKNSETTAYCNYWVGNQKFWDDFMAFAMPFYNWLNECTCEKTKWYIFEHVADGNGMNPVYPYLLERLFSTFLEYKNNVKFLRFRFPDSEDLVVGPPVLSSHSKTSPLRPKSSLPMGIAPKGPIAQCADGSFEVHGSPVYYDFDQALIGTGGWTVVDIRAELTGARSLPMTLKAISKNGSKDQMADFDLYPVGNRIHVLVNLPLNCNVVRLMIPSNIFKFKLISYDFKKASFTVWIKTLLKRMMQLLESHNPNLPKYKRIDNREAYFYNYKTDIIQLENKVFQHRVGDIVSGEKSKFLENYLYERLSNKKWLKPQKKNFSSRKFSLVYYIYPSVRSREWFLSLAQLKLYLKGFDQVLMIVAKGNDFVSLSQVRSHMTDHPLIKYKTIDVAHDVNVGAAFEEGVKYMRSKNLDSATVFCHSIGSAKEDMWRHDQELKRNQTEMMYHCLLSDLGKIDDLLRTYSCVGVQKKEGAYSHHEPYGLPNWHFKGSFLCFQNCSLFSKRKNIKTLYGLEAEFAKIFKSEEVFGLASNDLN